MFNFDTDPARLAKAAAELNARNPDLAPLKKRGGKIVQYSGWADQQVNPLPGIEYYETVRRSWARRRRAIYRLFMVPGMFHCNGGPGCSTVDWLAAVMEWVEKGTAPAQIIGAHVEAERRPGRGRFVLILVWLGMWAPAVWMRPGIFGVWGSEGPAARSPAVQEWRPS